MRKLCRLYLIVATISLALKGHTGASEAGEYKTWIPNTNWNNDLVWASGKIPCPLQAVKLGNPLSNTPLAVALTGENALQSLSLPINGELIFYKDAELTFFQDKDVVLDKCTEKGDIQFIASAPKMWYNPDNWQVTDVDGNPASNQANAILHMEKVPCQHDQVLFPKESSFNVGSTQPITVSTVTINGKSYSQSSFKDFLYSESGAMQFNLSKVSVQLTGQTCNDPKGCICNTIKERTTICNHVTCALPQCSEPLEPIGSCCAYCGTLIKVKPEASFRFNEFKTKTLNLTAKLVQNKTLVHVSISRVGDTIQVVFTDYAKGEEAQRVAEQVAEQTSGSSDYTIIKRSQSGRISRSETRKDDSNPLALLVGLGVGLLLLIIIVIAVVLWRRKTRSTERARPRFGTGNMERIRSHSQLMEEDQNGTELEEMPSATAEEGTQEPHHNTDTKYENLASDNLLSDNLLYEGEVKKTFENPLYESASEENLERVI